MGVGRLLVRGAIGTFFVGHGTQKLFGWFGGHGPEGTGQFFESVGIRPGRRNAIAAGAAEAGGGLLLALGLATPMAAAALSGVMVTAIHHVHAKNGPWSSDGGYEYNAVLLAALFAITAAGPGTGALDESHAGTAWAVAEFAAGLLGSEAVLRFAGSQPAPAADAGEAMDAASGREPAPAGATA